MPQCNHYVCRAELSWVKIYGASTQYSKISLNWNNIYFLSDVQKVYNKYKTHLNILSKEVSKGILSF